MKRSDVVEEEEEEEAAVRSTAQKLYCPAPSCRTPITGESSEITAFLALLHDRERIDEDRRRRLRGELFQGWCCSLFLSRGTSPSYRPRSITPTLPIFQDPPPGYLHHERPPTARKHAALLSGRA